MIDLVHTHGFETLCQHHYPSTSFHVHSIQAGDMIYVNTYVVHQFIKDCLHKMTQPFILVSNRSDLSVPGEVHNYQTLINHPLLIHWFSQNCVVSTYSKLSGIPIGLDYHTLNAHMGRSHAWGKGMSMEDQEFELKTIRDSLTPIRDINYQTAVANFHHGMGYGRQQLRRQVQKALSDKSCVVWLPTQSRADFWKTLDEYAFVICPNGNGIETHRVWEVLCLGRIPIIEQSAVCPLFEGLPVVIVNDWNCVTAEFLEQVYKNILESWDSYQWEKLTMNYWIHMINSIKSL